MNPAELSKAMKPHVDTLLMATAIAQAERERVDPIQRRVLAELGYEKHDPRNLYLLPDSVAERYFERMNAIHLAEGFEKAAEGHCPALTAEHNRTKAEWALIEAAEQFFPGVTNNDLLCGTKDKGGLELRREYLDLLIKIVVNAPPGTAPLPDFFGSHPARFFCSTAPSNRGACGKTGRLDANGAGGILAPPGRLV